MITCSLVSLAMSLARWQVGQVVIQHRFVPPVLPQEAAKKGLPEFDTSSPISA